MNCHSRTFCFHLFGFYIVFVAFFIVICSPVDVYPINRCLNYILVMKLFVIIICFIIDLHLINPCLYYILVKKIWQKGEQGEYKEDGAKPYVKSSDHFLADLKLCSIVSTSHHILWLEATSTKQYFFQVCWMLILRLKDRFAQFGHYFKF